jgi:hypothetical protein
MSQTKEMADIREQEGSVLAELIRTPLFKDIFNNCLNEIDPKRGAATARTLLWEDPQLIMSLLASLPAVLNWIVGFLAEIGNQTADKFPPELVKSFMRNILEDIDNDALRDCADNYGRLIKGLLDESPEFKTAVIETAKGPVASAAGKGINSAVKYVNELHRQDPMFIKDVLSGVISNIDGKEFAAASTNFMNAALDQKPPLFSWGWNLIAGRIKSRFKR